MSPRYACTTHIESDPTNAPDYTTGTIIHVRFFQPAFQGVWVNTSISLRFPNGTLLPLYYLGVHTIDDPSACEDEISGADVSVEVSASGTYTLLWRQTVWFSSS